MKNNVVITEKPDWVSWDEIHDVLMASHAENRSKGIVMSFPLMKGEEIQKKIGDEGKMLVALDGKKVVGTSGIIIKRSNLWCGEKNESYADCVFASVLPGYNGLGLFKKLDCMREKIALEMGINKMIGDTHEKNRHRLEIAKKAGYKFVGMRFYKDHFNVVMVKWLEGCPYSDLYCKWRFYKSWLYNKIRYGFLLNK